MINMSQPSQKNLDISSGTDSVALDSQMPYRFDQLQLLNDTKSHEKTWNHIANQKREDISRWSTTSLLLTSFSKILPTTKREPYALEELRLVMAFFNTFQSYLTHQDLSFRERF